MGMILKQGIKLQDFLDEVKRCNGEVFYKTEENDVLNLKSQLTQFLFVAAFYSKDLVLRGFIVCDDESDTERLGGYIEASAYS